LIKKRHNKLKKGEVKTVKFVKGIIIGTAITAGVVMMYNDGMMDRKRLMRRGRQLVRKWI